MFNSYHNVHTVYENFIKCISHTCNGSCLVNNLYGTLRWRKLENIGIGKENTKHQFLSLPNDYLFECIQILQRIVLKNKLDLGDDENVLDFKSSLPLLQSYWHVAPANPTIDIIISTVEEYTFSVFRSMQNFQVLTGTWYCSKYVCK